MLALELLEHCYKLDDDYTQQLLTYEIKMFSEQTNLGLAVTANHRQFIAHTACQVLLNDLWIGGLRMRKNTSLKARSLLGHLEHPWVGGGGSLFFSPSLLSLSPSLHFSFFFSFCLSLPLSHFYTRVCTLFVALQQIDFE